VTQTLLPVSVPPIYRSCFETARISISEPVRMLRVTGAELSYDGGRRTLVRWCRLIVVG